MANQKWNRGARGIFCLQSGEEDLKDPLDD